MPSRDARDQGFAMLVVVLAVGALVLIVTLVFRNAQQEYRDAQLLRRQDTLAVAAEAMLERYAAKMTMDPLFYLHWVDEAEAPRRCSDTLAEQYNLVVQPGESWYPDCRTWTYEAAAEFFHHPLLGGEAAVEADDVGALIGVQPPAGEAGLTLTVVTTQEEFGRTRAITAEIHPQAISEFAFLQQEDLRFGAGAVLWGKVYVGADLDFSTSSPIGVVHKNAYAEGAIGRNSRYGPPIFADGAEGYDSTGDYNDIRVAYPQPLDFDTFWDDLNVIREVACNGTGLCLSRTYNPGLGLTQNPTAFLVQPLVEAGRGRIKVWVSYGNYSTSCLTTEEWWWVRSDTASWNLLGTYDLPTTGVVWADTHLVIGRPSAPATVKGAVTFYAGTLGSPKNLIVGSDITYASGLNGSDVVGLIASDEVYLSPSAVGSDRVLNVYGAMLSQGGILGVSYDCGTSGNRVTPSYSTLNTIGGIAKVRTGNLSAHFTTRNYDFDLRLEGLRPPFFPLLGDSWDYAAWREIPVPCWAEGSCP